MKEAYGKTVLSLALIAVLITGILSACSTCNNDGAFTPDWWTDPSPYSEDLWGKGLYASPDDTYYELDLQWAAEVMELPVAWDISTGSSTIRVGIIDSGIDITHPDLQDRVNVTLSQSFVSHTSPFEDPVGHGTHVAGIIGANGNNGIGITGVCWAVELVSLRVTDERGNLIDDALVAAINSANDKGIDILNISLGTDNSDYKQRIKNAINNFDGLVVCAAGNSVSSTDKLSNRASGSIYPADIQANNLICVGASTHADTKWAKSHYGTTVDIFAPGSPIISCYPIGMCRDADCDSFNHDVEGYHSLSGTSMAAPNVAGVAALMLAIHPELSAAELKTIIMNSAEAVYNSAGNNVFGSLCVSGGRLNAYTALSSYSLHNFTSWQNADLSYHERTCTTCGYVQRQAHKDCWDKLRDRCFVCGRTGPVPDDPFFAPVEEEELAETGIIEHTDLA